MSSKGGEATTTLNNAATALSVIPAGLGRNSMKKLLLAMVALAASTAALHAEDNAVKIGVLNDQSSNFSAIGGTEVVKAVELAVKDFGGQVLGKPIEVVTADHQNRPDVALTISRQWFDQDGVDAIVDVANSAVSLGVNTLIGEKKKIGLFVSPVTDRMTEADCNGHVVAWAYDLNSTVGTIIQGLLSQGNKSFFILSYDYEAGKAQEAAVESAVLAAGGTVVGKVRAPLNTADFSSYILQAQASKADAIMLTIGGADLISAIKQMQEFGVMSGGQKIGITFLHQADLRATGTDILKGVRTAAPWFWTQDEASEKFGRRMEEITGDPPGWIAAGNYSAVTAYLKAVQKAGTDDPDAVLKAMRESNLDDFFVHSGELYPNGRLIHDMSLIEVKDPSEVKEKGDFFKLVTSVPAKQAFKPYSETTCKLPKS
jgi:branched-chain amino acid transport system substrate-binding protein